MPIADHHTFRDTEGDPDSSTDDGADEPHAAERLWTPDDRYHRLGYEPTEQPANSTGDDRAIARVVEDRLESHQGVTHGDGLALLHDRKVDSRPIGLLECRDR